MATTTLRSMRSLLALTGTLTGTLYWYALLVRFTGTPSWKGHAHKKQKAL